MGSLPWVSVMSGARRTVPAAPMPSHLARFDCSDSTALVYSDETVTARVSYAQLAARTNALARALAARARATGANRDGDFVVAVCMQPTHNTVMALLACWKAGAAYVPLEPSFPLQRINHILQDAQPALVVYDDQYNPSMFASSGVPSVSFVELAMDASSQSAEALNPMDMLTHSRAESIAIVLYTSGSTGVPKGVRLPYSAICNRLWWQFDTFPFSDTEATCVWKTALTFGDSVCEIWGPLLHGRALLILSRETTRDPQKLVRVLADNQIQRMVLVPTLLRSILMYLSLNRSENPLQNLKLWVCSGETLSKELSTQFFQYFGDHSGYKLANFYGSTEVMADVTYYMLENTAQLDNHNTIPIGAPLDNCEVYLLDEEMHPARESEVAEVWVAGANLACGYVGGQTPDKFCDNPHATSAEYSRLYRTGDFGMLQKGVILYAGRTDSQIKIRGHRVDLQEVECAVAAINGVEKAVILCYGQSTGNPDILAFVTIEPTAQLGSHHIEAALKNALTSYMIPQVIMIETIPLLVNGKVDRQALLKMYENTNNNDDSEIPLDTDYSGVDLDSMEKAQVLFETVGEVLGRAARGALSVRAGFYELGGNSLNTIYTITRLRDKGYHIEISDFLEAANLGEVLSKLSTSPDCRGDGNQPKFTAEPMREEHKDDVIEMIVTSFNEIKPRCYAHCISACLDSLHQARLSAILKDDVSKIPLDIDYSEVHSDSMEKAQALFETVGEVLGRAARGALSVRAGFYELGGNSLNSIYTITRLRDKGYYIEISDFLEAANLGEVLSKLSTSPECRGDGNQSKFTAEPMREEHKDDVIEMMVTSFYEIKTRGYARWISACWAALLQAGLSVILKDEIGTTVAVALSFDARDEPEFELKGGLAKTMAFLEFLEGSIRDTMLPQGKGTILHSFLMATAEQLSAPDNVAAILALEHATMRVARDNRFQGVFATNTSPLTQQLGTDVLGFQTLLDYQMNQYVDSNGDRIFGEAPDDMRAIVCWKTVE